MARPRTPSEQRTAKNAAHNAKRREGFAKGITSPDRLNRYARGEPDPVRDNPKLLARVSSMPKPEDQKD